MQLYNTLKNKALKNSFTFELFFNALFFVLNYFTETCSKKVFRIFKIGFLILFNSGKPHLKKIIRIIFVLQFSAEYFFDIQAPSKVLKNPFSGMT